MNIQIPKGTILSNKIHINEELGRGAFGAVFEALDLALQRKCAAKILKVENVKKIKEHLEARVLLSCEHQNVVEVFEVILARYDETDILIICMELMDKGSLTDLQKTSSMSFKAIIKILIDILFALETAHEQAILHRDIKPDNIMLSVQGAKLSDFGLAAFINEFNTNRSAKGSPIYMAPESHSENITNISTDIYSVGITFFQLLMNILDWDNTLLKVFNSKEEILSALKKGPIIEKLGFASHIPAKLKRICRKACHKQPEKRYKSSAEFRQALAKISIIINWNLAPQGNSWFGVDNDKRRHELTITKKKQVFLVIYKVNNRKRNNLCKTLNSLKDAETYVADTIGSTVF